MESESTKETHLDESVTERVAGGAFINNNKEYENRQLRNKLLNQITEQRIDRINEREVYQYCCSSLLIIL